MVAVASNIKPQTEPRIAVVFSSGIRAIRHLCELADVDLALSPKEIKRQQLTPSCVLVWGRKSNTEAALKYANEHGILVRFLEDGWIRSSSSNPHSRTCYSILNDATGVYYDSRTPSDLENLLNLPPEQFSQAVSSEQIDYACACRQRLVSSNITKYNFTSMQMDEKNSCARVVNTKQVLVVDQTKDDASVVYGGMNAQRFEQMLHTAIEENPDARIMFESTPMWSTATGKGICKRWQSHSTLASVLIH